MPGRDSKGRFTRGNPGGPGRPPLGAELPFVEGIKAAVSAEQVAQVMDRLFTAGMNKRYPNIRALELWLAYAVGKPADTAVETRLAALEAMVGQVAISSNGHKARVN
jgi:hypothetical protein